MLEDIAQYLSEVAKPGVDMFLCRMPEQPNELLALYEYAGQPPQQRAGMCAPGLQLLARGAGARGLLDAVHRLLTQIGFEEGELAAGALLNGTRYFRVVPTHSGVVPLGTDNNGRELYARNYYVYMEEK